MGKSTALLIARRKLEAEAQEKAEDTQAGVAGRDTGDACAVCGGQLDPKAVYGQEGDPGIYCSTECMDKAPKNPKDGEDK